MPAMSAVFAWGFSPWAGDAHGDPGGGVQPFCHGRNKLRVFEARIHPEVKANYLASPPLVVAYALAGRMDIDLLNEPLGQDDDGNDVFLHDIWPTSQEINT